MYLRTNMIENIYEITDIQKEKIIFILERYCQKIKRLDFSEMNYDELVSILFVIGEIYPLLDDADEWEEYHYQIMEKLKTMIENGRTLRLSLYGGLCNTGMAVYNLGQNTGYYKRFYEKLNQLILKLTEQFLKELLEKEEVATHDFDVISGISGILYYLVSVNLENDILYNNIAQYINKIVKDTNYYNWKIPGWYVNKKNQNTLLDAADYPDGNINYSLSHGIAGPLLSISILMKKNISENCCKISIKRIIDEYRKIGLVGNKYDNCVWPGIIDINDYISKRYDKQPNERMSWCYGSIGVLRSMYEAAKVTSDHELEQYVREEVCKIAVMDEKDYLLNSPILCHGYAGLIALLLYFYKETKEECIILKVKELLEIVINMYSDKNKFGYKDIIYKKEQGGFIKQEEDKNGFLDGASGVVLVLLAFLKDQVFFERMLLL